MGRGYTRGHLRLLALRKLFAVALTVSFVFSPVSAVLAQEVGSDTPTADTGSGTPPLDTIGDTTPPASPPAPEPSQDFSIPGVEDTGSGAADTVVPSDQNVAPPSEPDATVQTPDTGQSTNSDSNTTGANSSNPAISPPQAPLTPSGGEPAPTISAPNLFGLNSGAPKVDGATGAFTQNIKLDIPPGRNGTQPDLSLNYNSQDGEDSIVGYGWSISIPYIQRLNKTGSQNLYNNPYFTSSIDGELATTSNATSTQTFSAKVDGGNFNAYSFTNNVWTMYDKNGTRYLFGASDNSQQNASASSTQIYKWMLQEIRDTNNNYVRFTYTKDNNQIYPSQIIYTGNASSGDGPFTISFVTSVRPDSYENYAPGFKVTTNYRISQINAAINGSTVRQYNLSYLAGNNGFRSLLSGVQENGWNTAGAEVSYPATSFSYTNTSTQFIAAAPYGSTISTGYAIADMNGDGRNDYTTMYDSVGGTFQDIYSQRGNSTGIGWPSAYRIATAVNNCSVSKTAVETGTRVVDVNGDGKADIINGVFDTVSGTESTTTDINSSNGSSYSFNGPTPIGTIPPFVYGGETSGILGDVNGDGFPDFEENPDGFSATSAYFGNGALWDTATTTVFSPAKGFPVGPSDAAAVYNSQLVDVNGDGLPDWVFSDSSNTYVLLNTGTGWETSVDSFWTIPTSTLYLQPGSSPPQYFDRGMRFLDINGDGLPDFVRGYSMGHITAGTLRPEEGTYSIYMLNTGHGFATSTPVNWGGTIVSGQIDSGVLSGICNAEQANFNGLGQHAQDVISGVTSPHGGTINVTYGESVDGTNPSLPFSILTVSSIQTSGGFGDIVTKNYSYGGGLEYFPANIRDRKFAGFATSTENDGTTLTTTYYDQGITFNTSNGEKNDGWGQINHPYLIDVAKASDSTPLRRTFYRWDTSTTTGGNGTFVFKAREVTEDFGPTGDHRDKAMDYTYSPTTGNLIQTYNYGEVSAISDGTFSDIGNDQSITNYTYAQATSTGSNLNVLIEKAIGTPAVATSSTSTSSTVANMLLVAGGGGGNYGRAAPTGGGGGGGGGGVVSTTSTVTVGSYTITVGAGGQAGIQSLQGALNGGDSAIGAIATATGGGNGGQTNFSATPSSGGSGGGGGGGTPPQNGASGTAGQGNNGGNGSGTGGVAGGGGGGAGAAGGNASGTTGGNGGNGVTSSISGSPTTYGGGGGGGTDNIGINGSGGTGGGGNGGIAQNGITNTGGGGGGGQNDGSSGGAGGSGIVIISVPLGAITSASGGTHTTANGNDIWTFTTSGTWTINTLSAITSTSNVIAATSSDSRFYYDSLPFGQVAFGNNTKQENWISGSTFASTTKVYDGTYGLVTQVRDADGNLSTSTLDTNNLYVATTTNPLFQTTGYQYDYSTGRVITTFDANKRLYTTSYDGVGRPLTVSEPDPLSGSLVTKTTYAYTDNNTPGSTSVLETDYLSSATSTAMYSYLDGLGRNLQQRKIAEGNNTYVVKDWKYNNVGLLASESLPYFASSTARSTATTTSQLYTNYTYDALQRAATVVNSVGTTSNAYDAWTVTATDANGKLKDYTKDAYGNLAKVVEHISSSTATTTYTWDLNKSLTNITDAAGNVRNFTYDGLGRKLTAEDLHVATDTTFGTSTFAYDAAGNLASTTDAKGQTINYAYDQLNRKITEDYTGQSGTEITNTYDLCGDGKGRLCIASSTASRIVYNYNPLGLQSSASSTLNGSSTPFVTQYTYDRQGNQILVTNPDSSQIQNNYNSAGLLDSVLEKETGGSFGYIERNIDYSPTGQQALVIAGNWATTTNSYNQNALYRLTQKITQVPSGSRAQDLSYTYDALGNITQLVDAGTSGTAKTVNYTYDDLSRLLTASTTNASTSPNYKYTYTYDVLGNILSGPLGNYTYGGSSGSSYADPDAVTAIGSTTLTYDKNGNLTAEGTTTYTWDYRNRLTQSGNGSATSSYAYDDQDNRIKLTEGSTTTFFPTTLYNAGLNATTTKQIFGNGILIGTIETAAGSTTSSGSISTSTPTLDASSTSITTTTNGTTTKTWTLTATSGDVIVLTADLAQNTAGIGSVGSASWNGGAFTKATSTRRSNVEAETWYLVATSTGAKTMSVTINGTTTSIMLGAQSFSGVSTTSPFEIATSSNGSGGNPSVGLIPANTNDLIVSTLSKTGGGTTSGGGGGASTSTPALVQSTFAPVANSVAFSSAVTGGDTIVVGITEFGQTLAANDITDSKGNTYTKIAEAINTGTTDHAAIYYAKNVAAGATTISSTDDGTIAIHEYSGLSTSSNMVNATSTKFGSLGATFSSGIATSTVGNDLFFSVAWSNNSGDTWTAKNGYTLRQQETDNVTDERLATEDQVIASASTSAAWYTVSTSDAYAAALAAFRPLVTGSGGGGGSSTSADATSSQTTLWKNATTSFFGGASYAIATTTATTTDTYTTATSTNWVMIAIALRPATTTSSGGSSGTGSTTIRYVVDDNLGGSSVITDTGGNVAETTDYYPYGGQRIDTKAGGYGGEKRKYAGTEYDALSGLNYMQARYQDPQRGEFLSEDPIFLGDPKGQVLTDPQSLNSGRTMGASNSASASGWNGNTQSRGNSIFPAEFLLDPQRQNSYSYARNNPVNMADPSGLWGIFYSGNVGGDAGLAEGFSGSLSSGVGFTAGNSLSAPVDFGAFSSYGGLVGGPFQSVTTQGVNGINNSNYAVFGLAGGVSRGVTFTNATRISQLQGSAISWNVNLGIGTVSWSRSTEGIWSVSLSLGAKPIISFSTYPTMTVTNTTKSVNVGSSGSASPGNAHTACGTLCQ